MSRPRGTALRIALGGMALAVAVVLGLTGVAAAPSGAARLLAEVVAVAWIVLVLALWRWPGGLTVAVVLVALPWAVALVEHPRAGAAVGLGVGMVLLVELAGWSIDQRSVVPEAMLGPMALRITAAAVAGAALSGGVLAAAALPAPGSLVRVVLGLGAIVAVVAFVTLRRWEA